MFECDRTHGPDRTLGKRAGRPVPENSRGGGFGVMCATSQLHTPSRCCRLPMEAFCCERCRARLQISIDDAPASLGGSGTGIDELDESFISLAGEGAGRDGATAAP